MSCVCLASQCSDLGLGEFQLKAEPVSRDELEVVYTQVCDILIYNLPSTIAVSCFCFYIPLLWTLHMFFFVSKCLYQFFISLYFSWAVSVQLKFLSPT